MKLIIDIPEEKYNQIINRYQGSKVRPKDYEIAILNGIPLEQEPVLDKIRDQIKSHLRGVEITLEVLVEGDPLRPKMEGAKSTLEECLGIIDKAETEE